MAAPLAANVSPDERLQTYVRARAASEGGDGAAAARLFASLVRDAPGESSLRQRAIRQAIEAGEMELALSLARGIRPEQSALDLRMLLVAEDLRKGRGRQALSTLGSETGLIDTGFLKPFIEAWTRAERRDRGARDSLNAVVPNSPLGALANEHRALILLKLRQPAEAAPFAEQALASAGGRADRLRLAFADGFLAAGDRATAARMLEGKGSALAAARARLAAGKPLGQAIDSAADAFGELMIGLGISLNRLEDKSLPISLARVGRYASDGGGASDLLLGLLLDEAGRDEDALRALRQVAADDPFAGQALDAEARILNGLGREREALVRAQALTQSAPGADSWSRLGSVLSEMDRHAEAADAFGRALAAASTAPQSDEPWALHLFRASVLERSGRWPEAKAELETAMRLSPDNALLLNFLGYGKLERGEDLDAAEAMIRKASALRPDDASITDSLGWAQYKRGKIDEAIATLERAAEGDPTQSEIREHLGDALYTAGRRIEARFAWQAALVTADDKVRKRLEAKIADGLTKATAAP